MQNKTKFRGRIIKNVKFKVEKDTILSYNSIMMILIA